MFNIESYLKKIKKKINSEEEIIKKIQEIIFKKTTLLIDSSKIEIKNYTVYIKDSPNILNKIFINKKQIIDEIENFYPNTIVDIK